MIRGRMIRQFLISGQVDGEKLVNLLIELVRHIGYLFILMKW